MGLVAPPHVGSSRTRDQTCVSCFGRWILYHWATREALDHMIFNVLRNMWFSMLVAPFCSLMNNSQGFKLEPHFCWHALLSAFLIVYGFSSSRICMWELGHKESWAPKNWCFWTVVLQKTLESPLNCKEIQAVHPKGNQCWIFIGRTYVEVETPIPWPPDAKNWLTGKDPDAGKNWRQEEKGTTEDEMVRWHHWLNGHEFE